MVLLEEFDYFTFQVAKGFGFIHSNHDWAIICFLHHISSDDIIVLGKANHVQYVIFKNHIRNTINKNVIFPAIFTPEPWIYQVFYF